MRKKLMVTGFDPFGGETINPAWEAVKLLPNHIEGLEIFKFQVPTIFGKAADIALKQASVLHPDAILCIGQAGGRNAITPEMVAINLQYAAIPDNDGQMPKDQPVCPDGPSAYFSTMPVRKMAQAITDLGLPAAVSYSAGAFVCNDLLYSLLHHYHEKNIPVGFIHVPYLPQQAKKNIPSLPLEQIIHGLTGAISALTIHLKIEGGNHHENLIHRQ